MAARQPVDLVDEEHVAGREVGEKPGEVALLLERGAAGDVQRDPELGGDDVRQRRLAQPGRAREQAVIERLAPRLSRLHVDLQLLDAPAWPTYSSKARGRRLASRRCSSLAAKGSSTASPSPGLSVLRAIRGRPLPCAPITVLEGGLGRGSDPGGQGFFLPVAPFCPGLGFLASPLSPNRARTSDWPWLASKPWVNSQL